MCNNQKTSSQQQFGHRNASVIGGQRRLAIPGSAKPKAWENTAAQYNICVHNGVFEHNSVLA